MHTSAGAFDVRAQTAPELRADDRIRVKPDGNLMVRSFLSVVERFFAWMQWKRRLLVRWEYYPASFLGFMQLASLTILLKGS